MKLWKKISLLILILTVAFIGTVTFNGYQRYHNFLEKQSIEDRVLEIKNKPNYVSLDQVSPMFLSALLAVEDPSFYEHDGILLSNIIEAFFTNVKEHELVMGGSTITQQLCKNLFLDQKKNFHRKAAELFFVHDMEQKFSKDTLLELYINSIYYGDGYYGIEDAAKGYFQVSADELSDAQAIMLAGLPQAPAIYQLSDGFYYAKKRQGAVLEEMVEQNLLTKEEKSELFQQKL